MSDPLLKLPVEIVTMILDFLPSVEIIQIVAVSHAWSLYLQEYGLIARAKEEILAFTASEMGEPNTWSRQASLENRVHARRNFKKGRVKYARRILLPANCQGAAYQAAPLLNGLFALNVLSSRQILIYDLHNHILTDPVANLYTTPSYRFQAVELVEGYVVGFTQDFGPSRFVLWSIAQKFNLRSITFYTSRTLSTFVKRKGSSEPRDDHKVNSTMWSH